VRNRIAAALGVSISVVAFPSASFAGPVVLGDALSRIFLMCLSEQEAAGDFPEALDLSCEKHPVLLGEMGTTRAHVSTSFGDVLLAAANTECVDCPFGPSTMASSRISFELVVVQHATPPRPLETVPVRITTAGEVGVSALGVHASGGTFLSSTLQTIFPNADVFSRHPNTLPQSGPILADEYAVTETLDLIPGHVYFGNIYVGCNQNSSSPGNWACGGQVEVSFALDQQAFELSQGDQSFDLAQYLSIQRSPNLVPEASALPLGAGAIAALALAARGRRSAQRSRSASPQSASKAAPSPAAAPGSGIVTASIRLVLDAPLFASRSADTRICTDWAPLGASRRDVARRQVPSASDVASVSLRASAPSQSTPVFHHAVRKPGRAPIVFTQDEIS
jgi:hypothetical protein